MAKIHQANIRGRQLAILAALVVLMGGAVLVTVFKDWMAGVRGMSADAAQESLTTVFGWCVGIGTGAMFLTGCHYWWWGRRVLQAQRFPPPGAMVLRDTIVLEGRAATSRGAILRIVGIMLILCAVGIAVASWWVLRMLIGVQI